MKLKDLLIAICGGVGFISVFLPWFAVSAFFVSITGNGFDEPVVALGVLALIVSLGSALWKLLSMFGVIKLKLDQQKLKIIDTSLGCAMVLFGIIAIIVVNAQSEGIASPAFGVFLLIIAGVAQIVLTWLKIENTIGKAQTNK